jgi:hypothetical protein
MLVLALYASIFALYETSMEINAYHVNRCHLFITSQTTRKFFYEIRISFLYVVHYDKQSLT